MFNILTDSMPRSVEIDGQEYAIHWEFQYGVGIELALNDTALEDSERLAVALNLLYEETPPNIEGALSALQRYMANDKPLNRAQKAAGERYKHAPAVYSFDLDSEYIFAAFWQQYGINLQTVQDLHWYEFRALLHALEDCTFTRIKGHRGADLARIKNSDIRRQAEELKEFWALPVSEKEQEEIDALTAALKGDGDLSKFL